MNKEERMIMTIRELVSMILSILKEFIMVMIIKSSQTKQQGLIFDLKTWSRLYLSQKNKGRSLIRNSKFIMKKNLNHKSQEREKKTIKLSLWKIPLIYLRKKVMIYLAIFQRLNLMKWSSKGIKNQGYKKVLKIEERD